MCISEGVLRARLDGEIEPAEVSSIEVHLGGCADCRSRVQLLHVRASHVQHLLSTLESPTALPNAVAALMSFRLRQRTADHLDRLLVETLEEPWYRSLVRQMGDLWRPKPEPSLVVTSKPVAVKDIWG